MNRLVDVLLKVHVAAGVVALLVLAIPLVVRKGGLTHRRVGWVYVGAMSVSVATALVLTPLRLLQRDRAQWGLSIFLGYVALLSFAACFYGVRVLRQKARTGPHRNLLDLAVPALLLVSALAMLAYGLLGGPRLAIYFAPIGVLVAVPQLRTLMRAPGQRGWFIGEHISGMLIASIATLTAFAVTNAGHLFGAASSTLVWLLPTFLLTPLIIYWRRLYSRAPGTAQAPTTRV